MSQGIRIRRPGASLPGTLALLAVAAATAFLIASCGEEDPVGPTGGDGDDPTVRGLITGHAFLSGTPEQTDKILVEFYTTATGSRVDTTYPDDEGLFSSAALAPGTYDVFASAPQLDGFGTASERNVVVIAGQTNDIGVIDVPDTSKVQILNIAPTPLVALVPRRPEIRGEFLSIGSGIKSQTFSLIVNGEQVAGQADLVIADDLRSGSFSYTPPQNLRPGSVDVTVQISNRGGNSTQRSWRFSILDGVQRRVPDDYATIQLALWSANDGDTVAVAPGVYSVNNLEIAKEVVLLATAILEGGTPEMTELRAGSTGRHLRIADNVGEETIIKGFLFRDANVPGRDENGGAIRCFSCAATVEQCWFEDNVVSEGRGGAISMMNGSAMRIADCRFINNRARRGGSIAMFDDSRPVIERSVFVGNQAIAEGTEGGLGGAIYLLVSRPRIEFCTFYDNSAFAAGGAVMADAANPNSSQVTSRSNLFVRNFSENGTIHLHNTSRFDSSCDGFQNHEATLELFTGTGPAVFPDRPTILDPGADPGFCDPGDPDLRLRSDSQLLHPECDVPGALGIGCGQRR
ncbi:MAG: right-handed parallel beta-helix repeat-containing protein [Candidatus Eiseniibacteriota bacterium]|jgi:hypothetical protein